MAQVLRIATAEARPLRVNELHRTVTFEDITRSLELVRSAENGSMTMISGVPGVGKTIALKQFVADLGNDGILITIAPDEGKPSNVATMLMGVFLHIANGKSLTLCRKELSLMIGRGRMLAVDEAQYLTKAGLEWLRALAEMTGCDLVLCGDTNLAVSVSAIPQLQSRMMRSVIVTAVPEADVQQLVHETIFDTREAIRVLHLVALKPGGLRNVQNVLRTAQLFAGRQEPDFSHLEAAIVDLKLVPKGGAK